MDEWQPEPLVAPQTAFEEADNEKLPVIIGFVGPSLFESSSNFMQSDWTTSQALERPNRHESRILQLL